MSTPITDICLTHANYDECTKVEFSHGAGKTNIYTRITESSFDRLYRNLQPSNKQFDSVVYPYKHRLTVRYFRKDK